MKITKVWEPFKIKVSLLEKDLFFKGKKHREEDLYLLESSLIDQKKYFTGEDNE